MPVYKSKTPTKDGKQWFFSLYYETLQSERKKYNSKKYATKKEAEEEEAKFIVGTKEKPVSSMTFEQLYKDYMHYKKTRIKYSSYYSFESIGKLYFLPYFKNKQITTFSINDIRKWQDEMIKKELSKKYLSKMHTLLVSIFNFGVKFHGLEKNVVSLNGNFKLEDKIKKNIDFWTLEEFNKFISVVDNPTYNLLFNTLYYTGIRKGEMRALTWKDLKADTLSIIKTMSEKGKNTSTKTKSSKRDILLHNKLI